MTAAWASGGSPPVTAAGSVTLLEGATFCISGRTGDVRLGGGHGLFYKDTRFLSRWELTVDEHVLEPLTATSDSPYSGTFVCRPPPALGTADSTLLVVRRRLVGNGLLEQLTVRNLGRAAAAVRLELTVDTDFAGLFDVKEGRACLRPGIRRDAAGHVLRLAYGQGREVRATVVTGDDASAVGPGGITWRLVVDARSESTLTAQVAPVIDGVEAAPRYHPGQSFDSSEPARRLAAWRAALPVVTTPERRLPALIEASGQDLGALRIFDPEFPDRVVVAAGAPWFMTLFGRDALLASWMLLPVDASLAHGTLQTLARLQGDHVEPLSEQQPGRILHEVRSGLDAANALGGGNVYYGSIDATPLFVMLIGELRRWGLPTTDVAKLLPHADRALSWIEKYGDRDGDGFVEYQRATDKGLLHQGWKDSFDAISFATGELAEPPIALAEVQGYVYAAYLARAHFAREAGDSEAAGRWGARAALLKAQFNEQFWLADKGYYALALDGQKRPVDALASNMGHCLWTGIIDQDKAPAVAAHLLSPDMFTGFGIRTLAASMGAYNPVSYHNGSVWPHDSALVAGGLMRYGFVNEAQQVAVGLLDAAEHFGGRLPELFCGFDRAEFDRPVPYPTSCAPQAWAAAAPLFLLRTLLRFDPWVPFGQVWCDPAVPHTWLPMRVERLNLAGRPITVEIDHGGRRVTGVGDGLELQPGPRPPQTSAHAQSPQGSCPGRDLSSNRSGP